MSDQQQNALKSFKEVTKHQNDEDIQRLLTTCRWDVEQAINVFFMRKSRIQHNDAIDEAELGQNGEVNCAKIGPSANYRWRIQQNGNNPTDSPDRTSIFKVPSERSCSNALKFDHDQMLKENEINEMLETVRHSIHSIPPTQGLVNRLHDKVFEQLPASSTAEQATFEQLSAAHRAGLKFNTRMDLGQELVYDGISRVPPTQPSSSTSTMEAENGLKIHRSLKTLYRPPVELMFRGDWEQALELAKTTKMWLLVNVQNALEFASAKINRDIWGVETVQEIIKTNFILWQVYHDSSDGIRIRSYYGLEESYPIIFIVDPRTGEEVQRLRAPDESFFLDLLTTFVAENPTFEARDRQFHEKNGQSRKQNQLNREHIDGPGSSWTPSELSSDEWIKWTVKEADLVSPCPGTVHLSLRLPNGQTERVRMWKAAPLNALFSLLLSRGHSSYNYQLVLDYPRREFVLSNQNRFCPLEEMGFGPQEVIHINTIEESVI